jgi:hypothetical protein
MLCVQQIVDGLGFNNFITIIVVTLMKSGGITQENLSKKLLWFGPNGAFVFKGQENKNRKTTQRISNNFFNGCPL